MARTGARLTCPSCGADWGGASARFCGHCGQRLVAAPPTAAGGGVPGRGRVVFVVAVALLVAGAGLVAFLAVADVAGTPAPDRAVELPLDVGTAQPAPTQDLACAPVPCERWRVAVGPGEVVVAGDVAYHRSLTHLTAVDVADGRELWSQRSEDWPAATGAALRPGGGQAWDLGDDLVVFLGYLGGDGVLEARSAADGARLWTRPFVGRLQPLVAVRAGDQVVVAAFDPLAPDQRGRVLGFAVEDGAMTWSVEAHRIPTTFLDAIMATGSGGPSSRATTGATTVEEDGEAARVSDLPLVVWTGQDEVAGLDPATGEPRWTRSTVEQLAVSTGGTTAMVVAGGVVEMLEVPSGDTLRSFELDLASDAWVHLQGELLLVEVWGDEGVAPRVEIRSNDDGALLSEHAGMMFGPLLAEDGGLVVGTFRDADVVGGAGTVDVVGIDGDGRLRWQHEFDVAWRECCWNLVDAGDDRSVLVAKNLLRVLEVVRIDRDDGTVLDWVELQPVLDGSETDDGFGWHPVLTSARSGRDTVLVGPAGSVSLHGGGRAVVVSMDPLLVASGDSLIAIDETVLLGDMMTPRWVKP